MALVHSCVRTLLLLTSSRGNDMIVLKASTRKSSGRAAGRRGHRRAAAHPADPGQRADAQDRRARVEFTTSDLEIQVRTSAPSSGRRRRQLRDHGRRAQADRHPALACRRTRPCSLRWPTQTSSRWPGGKSRFTLQTLPADDFPLVQESADFGPMFSVAAEDAQDLLDQVHFAMAVHDIRYYLNGILFVAEGKQPDAGGHRRPPPGAGAGHARRRDARSRK